jgi:hypothetical protein
LSETLGVTEPLARYEVRTPGWVWGGLALAAVATAGLGWQVVSLPTGLGWRAFALLGSLDAVTLGLYALIALLPLLALWASAPYRVGGKSIDVYADRVEMPRAWRGRVAYPLRALSIARVRVVQQVTVMHIPTGVQLDRGEVVTFSADGLPSRKLSDRVFVEESGMQFLLADLAAVSNGQPPRGAAGWSKLFDEVEALVDAQKPADSRDAELDEELRRRG